MQHQATMSQQAGGIFQKFHYLIHRSLGDVAVILN